jgi:hypothetical protein
MEMKENANLTLTTVPTPTNNIARAANCAGSRNHPAHLRALTPLRSRSLCWCPAREC